MRLDRTVSLYVSRPWLGLNFVSGSRALPILMYHSISDDSESGISPYYRTATSPAVFAQQIRWLSEEGFQSINLEEGIRHAQQGCLGREKFVVITFDDGFRDFHDSAFPILKKHGYTATVFLPAAFINGSRRSFKNKECLTWNEVRALRTQGVQFGSHTASHPVLYELSWVKIKSELSVSKEKLEQELGEKITSFAYPYAFPQQDQHFTAAFKRLLQEQGYQFCMTTMIGRVQAGADALSLKRLPVNGEDDKPLLLAKLSGAYDWLAYPQSWFKSARRLLGGASWKPHQFPAAQSS